MDVFQWATLRALIETDSERSTPRQSDDLFYQLDGDEFNRKEDQFTCIDCVTDGMAVARNLNKHSPGPV